MGGSRVESRGESMVESSVGSRVESMEIQRDTDQQGRWSLPARTVFASGWGMAVSGWEGAERELGQLAVLPLPGSAFGLPPALGYS